MRDRAVCLEQESAMPTPSSTQRARRLALFAFTGAVLAGCMHMPGMHHAGMGASGGAGCCCAMMMGGGRHDSMQGGMTPGQMHSSPGQMHSPSGAMAPQANQGTGRYVAPMQMAAAGPMCGGEGGACGSGAGGATGGAGGCACCRGMMGANPKPM